MDPRLTFEAAKSLFADRLRQADSPRLAARHSAEHGPGPRQAALPGPASVTMRLASPEDARALDRLAQLDSGALPAGPALVAEVDGELVAALPLGSGRPLADPFRPTAELVGLLELRAAQLNGDGRRPRRRLRATRRADLRPETG
jgi:hypothetical protein